METTRGKSVPDALEMIAGWIREELEIEVLVDGCHWFLSSINSEMNESVTYNPKAIYRARPRKPRTCTVNEFLFTDNKLPMGTPPIDVVELTPEVREALEKEGLL